jgi:hypothetical protein
MRPETLKRKSGNIVRSAGPVYLDREEPGAPGSVSEWDRVAVAAVADVPAAAGWLRAGLVRAGGYRARRGS